MAKHGNYVLAFCDRTRSSHQNLKEHTTSIDEKVLLRKRKVAELTRALSDTIDLHSGASSFYCLMDLDWDWPMDYKGLWTHGFMIFYGFTFLPKAMIL